MMDIFACLMATYTFIFSVAAAGSPLHPAAASDSVATKPVFTASVESSEETDPFSDFQITTSQNTYKAAYPNKEAFLGTVSIPDIGFNLNLYWSTAQDIVDKTDAGAMCCYTCLPGDLYGSALIIDHNYQQGKKLGKIEPGVKIYLDLTYGQYIFEASDTAIVEKAGTETITMPQTFLEHRGHEDELGEGFIDTILSDGRGICKSLVDDSQGDLYFMTCYPFDAKETDKLFFVRCKLIQGTELIEDWENQEENSAQD